MKSRPLPFAEDFAYRQPHLNFDEFEASPPFFSVSNFDLHYLELAGYQRGPWVILMRLSEIFTSTLRDDPGEWDLEAKKGLSLFQTNCRVVSEKEAILPSGSSADLRSRSSANLR